MTNKQLESSNSCTGCKICQNVCSLHLLEEINIKKCAINIIENFGDEKLYDLDVCTQCGVCAKVCPEDCINQNEEGVFIIDADKCTGCAECISSCPFDVMTMNNNVAKKCDMCGECIAECPVDNLKVRGEK